MNKKPTSNKIDRREIHQYLWANTDRQDFLIIKHGDVAVHFGISIWQMSRIFGELQERGCLTFVGRGRARRAKIIDPALAVWDHGTTSNERFDDGPLWGDRPWKLQD